jgi:hypothetical protein
MSRWFRLDDDVINDPKILRLPEAMRWIWVAFLCIASKNGGILPVIEIVAISLRVKPSKAAEYLTKLVMAGLIDHTETGYVPHNWNARQFKSDTVDATAAERMRRYRALRRNARNGDGPVTVPTDREQNTERKKDSDRADALSGADAPIDHRKRLFDEGLPKLAKLTGKGSDACRSFVGKCLKASGDDAVTVLGLIDEAERNQAVDPSAWIASRLKNGDQFHGKTGSRIIQAADDLCRKIAEFDGPRQPGLELRDEPRPAPPRLLSHR